ncbi:host cell division inhibitor Icd-like protein [Escherichia coli]|uniref:Host cell division inhibitor Icd-like protein n=2 Tax=Escherichia coli TaxID=562 RepID=A0A8S7I3B2_ECOLX|nr:host cell division inhibitor Icd-like protein [Escherichia coli]EFB6345616.1 host cell division inhibitor Icd-like protein [Escherichia coli]EFC2246379.1 host cell division inhibitor Icd-like protein [Escherichia coli]EFN6121500.1 host cell division inhibitor Icd-like protein [Escherichia coli]EFO1887096.1 host cell division inhibitor Icd-like protein [Escherichia coli]
MCNALTVTKRESAPLPERLCERIAYCAILLTVYEADYSVVVAQSEGADHRFYSTPEMQNILLQNVVGHTVRKAKNFAGGATDAILSGRQVLINLMSDFVLDKTKATAEDRQWESYILERIANNARFAAGGQCVSFAPMTLCLTEGHYGEYAGLLVGYSCSLTLPCRDVFQVCDPIFVRLYSLRNFSRINAQGANLFDSCSYAIFLRRLFRAGDGVLVDSLLVILCTCKAMRRSSSHHGAGDGYSCSLALRRWRRLISPRMAVTINCASVSFSSLTKFISLKTSRGILAVFCCDLLLVVPVGITGLLTVRWRSVYVEKKIKKGLKCKSPKSSIIFKGDLHLKDKAPQVSLPLAGLLTTNDNDSIEVAMLNHTTHPQGRDSHNLNKYIWRFIALSTAQPRVIHIEATSEQEARQQSPDGCVMVFAARIRQEVRHD